MKTLLVIFVLIGLSLVSAVPARPHCEVPCGIYNDKMRIEMIREHITTIEKAMNKITELGKEAPVNFNQVVRWTTNKEKHAEELQHIVHQYFLTQRVKPADPADKSQYDKYTRQVTILHQILVSAMKAKQTTNQKHADELRSLTKRFGEVYFEDKEHAH
jgi:nickel superoxide dismutase